MAEIYLPVGGERRWAADLAKGRSMILIGERGSGLSTAVGHALDQIPESDKPAHITFVSARLLAKGTGFLVGLAYECVSNIFENSPPPEIESLLHQLQDQFEHHYLVRLLVAITDRVGRPFAVIDRFDDLAMRLDPAGWASLRYVIEKGLLQIVVLSRLSISEIETLSHSKFSQSIILVIHKPIETRADFASFCREVAGLAADFPEDGIDYLRSLSGGHRKLTLLLCKLVKSENGSFGSGVDIEEAIDQAIRRNRDALRYQLIRLFPGLAPQLEPQIQFELRAEVLFAVSVDHYPASMAEIHQNYCKRLQRLGHFRMSPSPHRVEFTSELLRSFVHREYLRAGNLDLPADLEPWLRFDEILRALARACSVSSPGARRGSVDRSAGAGETVLPAEGETSTSAQRAREKVWWGEDSRSDELDAMIADEISRLLETRKLRERGLAEEDIEGIREYSEIRKPVSRQPWTYWSPTHRKEIGLRLDEFCNRLESLLRLEDQRGGKATEHKVKENRVIRWLHISDAHFRSNKHRIFGEDAVRPAFLRTLRSMKEKGSWNLGPAPDLIFFTGDVAFSGKDEEYEEASGFFEEILEISDLGVDRLFLIPGNHDVDREATKFLERGPTTEEESYYAFSNPRWLRLYGERLRAYDAFCGRLFQERSDLVRKTEFGFIEPRVLDIRGTRIVVHSFNAQLCGGLDDDQSKLVLGVSLMKEELEARYSDLVDFDLRIGLLHQPIDHLVEFEQRPFLQLFGRFLDVLLLGHMHDNDFSKAVNARSELIELKAGALFGGMDRVRDNSAQMVECDIDSRELRVYPIRFEPKQDRWERDTSLADPPDYIFRARLPR